MGKAQALELVKLIQLMAIKTRSNLLEGVGDDEVGRVILASLSPYLFGEVNLVEVTQRLLAKGEHLEPIDMYNLLLMVEKTPAMQIAAAVWGEDLPLPSLEWYRKLRSDWEVT